MRSYGQYCSVAKALDVIGDRWTLLIVRELLLRGACRYTDLRNGLPGIATNLLADRLRDLETGGLISREDAPPPVATTLFRLTPAGVELDSVLRAMAWWGVRFMTDPADDDEFRGQWFSFPVSVFLHDSDPQGPPLSIELRAAGTDPVVVSVPGDGTISTQLGASPSPDLVIGGTAQRIMGLLSGQRSPADSGLTFTGNPAILARILPAPDALPTLFPGTALSA